jgi:hypothetical protein
MTIRKSVFVICVTLPVGLASAAPLHVMGVPFSPEPQAAKLVPHFGPKSRTFIAAEAASQLEVGAFSSAQIASDAGGAGLGISSNTDIDAIVALVLFQCAADARQDLRDALAEMQKQAAEKKAARDAISREKAEQGKLKSQMAVDYQGWSGTHGTPSFTLDRYASQRESLAAQKNELQDQKDSLSDLSQEQQLKLQLLMDRMTKADEALSNALKKFGDTASNIVGNMK